LIKKNSYSIVEINSNTNKGKEANHDVAVTFKYGKEEKQYEKDTVY
jgi:hypothetical protein